MTTAPFEQTANPVVMPSSCRNGSVAGANRPVHNTRCAGEVTTVVIARRTGVLTLVCASGLSMSSAHTVPSISTATSIGCTVIESA